MVQYIDKSTTIAKIKEIYNEDYKFLPSDIVESVRDFKDDLLAALDTFEAKELKEETVSEELEEAAQEYVTKEGYLAGLHYNSMVRSFKAGAEWYASHNTKLPDNLLLAARKASIDMCNIDDRHLDEYPYHPIAEQKFIEGAQWQEKKDQKTIELAEDHAMLADMEKMREQMMKDAVDGIVGYYNQRGLSISMNLPKDLEENDKVKVIIIKQHKLP